MSDLHFGHAYPFVYTQDYLGPPDFYIGDIDVVLFYRAFDPSRHFLYVTQLDVLSMRIESNFTGMQPITVPLADNDWSFFSNSQVQVKVFANRQDRRGQLWQGRVRIEPARIVQLGLLRQAVSVYNKPNERIEPKSGCQPYQFPDQDWVNAQGFVPAIENYGGNVYLSGGFSMRVSQYDARQELQLVADAQGGEGGRPCSGQIALGENEAIPYGRDTLDGAARCDGVLRSINGVSNPSFQFLAGNGTSVFSQPEKSRVTVRFDGAGSARCPGVEIPQANCPPTEDYCGPISAVDLCPDAPNDLATVRTNNVIPPIDDLQTYEPGKCIAVGADLQHLLIRACGTAGAVYTRIGWVISRPCNSGCEPVIPTDKPSEGTRRTVNCNRVPPDPTIGFRNADFSQDLLYWKTIGDVGVIYSHEFIPSEQLPGVELRTGGYIYQVEVAVPHRSVLRFKYFGKVQVSVVVLGNLCDQQTLESQDEVAVFVGDYVIRANNRVAVEFRALDDSVAVITEPYLSAV